MQYSIDHSKKFKSVTSIFLLLSMKNNMISKIKTPLTGHQCPNVYKKAYDIVLCEPCAYALKSCENCNRDGLDSVSATC